MFSATAGSLLETFGLFFLSFQILLSYFSKLKSFSGNISFVFRSCIKFRPFLFLSNFQSVLIFFEICFKCFLKALCASRRFRSCTDEAEAFSGAFSRVSGRLRSFLNEAAGTSYSLKLSDVKSVTKNSFLRSSTIPEDF